MGKHELVTKLLMDNGGDISSADVGRLACYAVEKNEIKLLKSIVECGGDVNKPTNKGTTALHAAVCDGNVEMVKFLLEQGADIDKQDDFGWTPRAYAEHQCHEEIQNIFKKLGNEDNLSYVIPPMPNKNNNGGGFIGKCPSEPSMVAMPQGSGNLPPNQELTWLDTHKRRRSNPFHNSLFGMLSAATRGKGKYILSSNLNKSMILVVYMDLFQMI